MKPMKIRVRNILGIKNVDIDFEEISQSGVLAIVGRNGSGKSSLFDAMMIALFGRPSDSRPVKQEDILRSGSSTNGSVSLIFESENVEWRASRSFKRMKRGAIEPEALLERNDPEKGWTPVASDITSVNDAITEILSPWKTSERNSAFSKMVRNAFANSALVPQGKITSIIDADPKERWEIISGSLGLDEKDTLQKSATELKNIALMEEKKSLGKIETLESVIFKMPAKNDVEKLMQSAEKEKESLDRLSPVLSKAVEAYKGRDDANIRLTDASLKHKEVSLEFDDMEKAYRLSNGMNLLSALREIASEAASQIKREEELNGKLKKGKELLKSIIADIETNKRKLDVVVEKRKELKPLADAHSSVQSLSRTRKRLDELTSEIEETTRTFGDLAKRFTNAETALKKAEDEKSSLLRQRASVQLQAELLPVAERYKEIGSKISFTDENLTALHKEIEELKKEDGSLKQKILLIEAVIGVVQKNKAHADLLNEKKKIPERESDVSKKAVDWLKSIADKNGVIYPNKLSADDISRFIHALDESGVKESLEKTLECRKEIERLEQSIENITSLVKEKLDARGLNETEEKIASFSEDKTESYLSEQFDATCAKSEKIISTLNEKENSLKNLTRDKNNLVKEKESLEEKYGEIPCVSDCEKAKTTIELLDKTIEKTGVEETKTFALLDKEKASVAGTISTLNREFTSLKNDRDSIEQQITSALGKVPSIEETKKATETFQTFDEAFSELTKAISNLTERKSKGENYLELSAQEIISCKEKISRSLKDGANAGKQWKTMLNALDTPMDKKELVNDIARSLSRRSASVGKPVGEAEMQKARNNFAAASHLLATRKKELEDAELILQKIKSECDSNMTVFPSSGVEAEKKLKEVLEKRQEALGTMALYTQTLKNIEETEKGLTAARREYEVIKKAVAIAKRTSVLSDGKNFARYAADKVMDTLLGRVNYHLEENEDPWRIMSVDGFLKVVDPDGSNPRSASGLSGGEKTRVALVMLRVLAESVKFNQVFFVDEGLSALDSESLMQVSDYLAASSKDDVTVVITHDMSVAERLGSVMQMDKGTVVEMRTKGPREEYEAGSIENEEVLEHTIR